MSAKVSAKPSLFVSHGKYYFKVNSANKRVTIATGCENLYDAEVFRDAWMSRNEAKDITSKPTTLAQLIALWTDLETNPKLKDSTVNGDTYTKRYAEMERTRARHLQNIITPELLMKNLGRLERKDCDAVMASVHKVFGNRPVAHDTFKTFKAMLNYAYSKGWMREMIAFRISNIKAPRQKELMVMPRTDLLKIYAHPEFFRNETDRDIFFVLMTTGMRRAELAAIQGKQLKKAKSGDRIITVLDISQSFKDGAYKTLDTPKWTVQRIIPLAPATAEIMLKYKKGDDDFIFHMGNSQWTDMFNKIRAMVPPDMLENPETLEDLSPHKLRHSLNSELLIEDANETLVQEYLAWHHQDRNKVQAGYTHTYIKSLLRISDLIEELYASEDEPIDIEDDFIIIDD